jgi:hypothetical protein
MNWKRFRKILSATAVSLALVSGTAISANADTTGGIGGGGGAGGAYSGFEWVSVVGEKGAAYDKFVELGRWGGQTDGLVNSRIGGNGVGICRDSNVIWFIRSGQGGWTYNYTGGTHGPSSGGVAGSIEVPYSQYGRAPIAAEINAFKDWDAGQNGGRIDGVPGYTIICSGKFIQPDRVWSGSSTRVTSDGKTGEKSYTYPHTWYTNIDRQALKGDGGIDTIGDNNLHSQVTVQRTSFGELYDSLNTTAGQGMSPSELETAVIKGTSGLDIQRERPKVDLDAKNKEGMAEGGILNVISRVKNATISTVEYTKVTTTTHCNYRQTWNSYWAGWNPVTQNCWDTNVTNVTRTSSKSELGTLETKSFWQMLAVHCNKEEFDALIASDHTVHYNVQLPSVAQTKTEDPTRTISAVAYTRQFLGAPKNLDFGNPYHPDATKAKTGNVDFFDKECPFDCTPSNASASGASTANGAVDNIGMKNFVASTPLNPYLFGAESESTNTNKFEFFRDNAPKNIKVDTWYPKSVNGVTYKGEAPLTTTITRDPKGTPSLDGSGGGKFTMKSSKGDTLFGGALANVNTQKNWDSSTFSGPTATILKGLHNKFSVQSTWASDADKPQAFNFKWEYAPTVKTSIPVTSIGFGLVGGQNVGDFGIVSTDIQGKCYTYFGKAPTDPAPNVISEFGDNTGTGTVNNLDKGLLTGDKAAAKLTTNFVRSTTE